MSSYKSDHESQLDADIKSLKREIRSLEAQLYEKENLKKKIVEKRMKEKESKLKRESRILTKASDRLKYGTRIYNKPCSRQDYSKGKIIDGYICSESTDGYRYRAPGNPGDKHFSEEDVVRATGETFMKNYSGKQGRRYSVDDVIRMRHKQIKQHEKDIVEGNISDVTNKADEDARRFAELLMRPKIMREAEEEFNAELGEGVVLDKSVTPDESVTADDLKNKVTTTQQDRLSRLQQSGKDDEPDNWWHMMHQKGKRRGALGTTRKRNTKKGKAKKAKKGEKKSKNKNSKSR